MSLFSIGGISTAVLNLVLHWLFLTVVQIIAAFTLFFSWLFNIVVHIRIDADMPIILGTWTILRNMANMLFILALIWMAFATIFNLKGKFTERIGKFIFVAVFINFSLVIGGLVIDACQVLVNIFLGMIGDPGSRLGQYLDPGQFLNINTIGTTDAVGANFFSILSVLILSAMFLFALAVATIFAIIRIFLLWGLLILSPIAWMSQLVPGNGFFKKWWGWFLGWNLFLPVYLFMLYIGLVFLSQKQTILNVISPAGQDIPVPQGFTASYSFSLFFFYAFAVAFMYFSLSWATKLTQMASLGSNQFAEWGVNKARNLVRRAPLPYVGSIDAAEKAALARKGQFLKEGFKNPTLNKVFGGEDAQKRSEAKAMDFFGVQGAGKQFVKDAGQAFDKAEDDYETGKMNVADLRARVAATKATSTEGYAYRKLAIKKGALNKDQFVDALASVSKNPSAIQDLIKTAKDAKFSGVGDLKSIIADPKLSDSVFIPAKRDLLLEMAGDPKRASRFDASDITSSVTILGGKDAPEAKKFLGDIGKVRPDLIAQYKSSTSGKSAAREMYKLIRDTDAKKLSELGLEVWRDSDFQNILKAKIANLNRQSPALPEGDLITRASVPTPPPMGAIILPNGSAIVPGKPGTIRGPGITKFKGRPGGGDRFKAQLDSNTTGDRYKNRIVASI